MKLAATKSDCLESYLPVLDSRSKLPAKARQYTPVEWTQWQSAEQGPSLQEALLEDALLTEQAVQQRLCRHYNRQLRSLTCEVRDGVVTLRGNVSEYYYKQLAQESVRHVAGTCRIHNCVEVVYNTCYRPVLLGYTSVDS
jgi:hypothetical protein